MRNGLRIPRFGGIIIGIGVFDTLHEVAHAGKTGGFIVICFENFVAFNTGGVLG